MARVCLSNNAPGTDQRLWNRASATIARVSCAVLDSQPSMEEPSMETNTIWALAFASIVIFLAIRAILKHYFPPDT
jgi:hypothetical protein